MKPLTQEQLEAIDRLEKLAAIEFDKIKNLPGAFHLEEYSRLAAVPSWAREVRLYHDNKYSESSVTSCLDALRELAKKYKFNLKGDE